MRKLFKTLPPLVFVLALSSCSGKQVIKQENLTDKTVLDVSTGLTETETGDEELDASMVPHTAVAKPTTKKKVVKKSQ